MGSPKMHIRPQAQWSAARRISQNPRNQSTVGRPGESGEASAGANGDTRRAENRAYAICLNSRHVVAPFKDCVTPPPAADLGARIFIIVRMRPNGKDSPKTFFRVPRKPILCSGQLNTP